MKCVTFLASFARIARLAMTYECILLFVVRAARRVIISIYTRTWTFFTRNTGHRWPVIAIFAAFTIVAFGVARATQANTCRRTILTPTMTITFLTRRRIKIAIETITSYFAYLILVAITLTRDCIAYVRLRAWLITIAGFDFFCKEMVNFKLKEMKFDFFELTMTSYLIEIIKSWPTSFTLFSKYIRLASTLTTVHRTSYIYYLSSRWHHICMLTTRKCLWLVDIVIFHKRDLFSLANSNISHDKWGHSEWCDAFAILRSRACYSTIQIRVLGQSGGKIKNKILKLFFARLRKMLCISRQK